MWQLVQVLLSGLLGTLMGCAATWLLVTQTERNRGRRAALVMAAKALQDNRVAYAQLYVEYFSPWPNKAGEPGQNRARGNLIRSTFGWKRQ